MELKDSTLGCQYGNSTMEARSAWEAGNGEGVDQRGQSCKYAG